jgi:hypothetical protein
MILKPKITIIMSTFGILVWIALFVVFYISPHDLGDYGDINFGEIRGASTARFNLETTETLLLSRRASDEYSTDVFLLVQKQDSTYNTAYIIRGQNGIFKQNIDVQYTQVYWDKENIRYVVESDDSLEVFWLIPNENEYAFEPAL